MSFYRPCKWIKIARGLTRDEIKSLAAKGNFVQPFQDKHVFNTSFHFALSSSSPSLHPHGPRQDLEYDGCSHGAFPDPPHTVGPTSHPLPTSFKLQLVQKRSCNARKGEDFTESKMAFLRLCNSPALKSGTPILVQFVEKEATREFVVNGKKQPN